MAKIVLHVRLARSIAMTALAATLVACSTEPKTSNAITADLATNGQSATVGARLSVKVHLTDNRGAGIPGAVITWTVTSHAGATAAPTSTTDATGTASMLWTLDTLARVDSMTASTPSALSATITATGMTGAPFAFTKISGDNQLTSVVQNSSSIGLDLLVVAVTDRYHNGIAGATIQWSSPCNFRFNGGAPTTSYSGAATDASGLSRLSLVFASPKGTCAIQASTNAVSTLLVFHIQGL